jgi:poly(3-hydroxybutyrate) depolymerase
MRRKVVNAVQRIQKIIMGILLGVVIFTGWSCRGTGKAAAYETGWNAKADQSGFFDVFPDAMAPDPTKPSHFSRNPQLWNDGSERFYTGQRSVDDVGFLNAMLDDLQTRFNVDQVQLFATGGSDNVRGKPKPPVRQSIVNWAKALGCDPAPQSTSEKNGVRTEIYGRCRDGAEMVYITVEGMGHTWAGGKSLLQEFMVGKRSDKIKATDVIWEFFKKHPMGN